MADYAVYGKKGTGKSKFAVYLMRQAAAEGRRIAANFPVNLDKLLPGWHKVAFTQIPDRPTVNDLNALGQGNPSYDEEKNGVLILDELAVWLNSRDFQASGRDGVINWAVHARKHGWDVYWLCQNPMQIDRQVRESLLEYSVRMKKLDQVRLPAVGFVLQLLGLRGTFPKGTHSAVIRLGFEHDSPLVDRKMFRADDLHECYDTRYVFKHDPEAVPVSWLGPRYFVPLPPQGKRRTGLGQIAAALGGAWSRAVSSRASSRQSTLPEHWPESIRKLPAELRWEVARRLNAQRGSPLSRSSSGLSRA